MNEHLTHFEWNKKRWKVNLLMEPQKIVQNSPNHEINPMENFNAQVFTVVRFNLDMCSLTNVLAIIICCMQNIFHGHSFRKILHLRWVLLSKTEQWWKAKPDKMRNNCVKFWGWRRKNCHLKGKCLLYQNECNTIHYRALKPTFKLQVV